MISKENSLYRKNDLPARGFAKKSSLRTEKFCIAKMRAIFDEKPLVFEQKSRWRKIFLYSEICAEDDKREGEEDKRQKKIAKQVLKIFL